MPAKDVTTAGQSGWDDRLAGLAAQVRCADPRFAEGLRAGRPVAPREYRQRAARRAVTVLACLQVAMLVIHWYPVAVAAGVATLAVSARRR